MAAAVGDRSVAPLYAGIPEEPGRPLSKAQIAIRVAEVVGGILLLSGAAAGLGFLMQSAAKGLLKYGISHVIPRIAGKVLKVVGEKLFLAGKYLFLSVAVPTYITVWTFPKWLALHGVPTAVRGFHRYALMPFCRGVVRIVDLVGRAAIKIAQALYTYVLRPYGHLVASVVKRAWNVVVLAAKGVKLVVDVARKAIIQIIQALYTYVLRPYGHLVASVAKQAWNAVVLVAKGVKLVVDVARKAIIQTIQALYTYVLRPLGRLVASVAKRAWNAVVLVAKGVKLVLDTTAYAAARTIQFIWKYALKPFGRLIFFVSKQIWRVGVFAVKGVALTIKAIALAFFKVIRVFYTYAIRPAINTIGIGSNWVWRKALVPSGTAVSRACAFVTGQAAQAAQTAHRSVIAPMGRFAAHTVQAISHQAAALSGAIQKVVAEIMVLVKETCARIAGLTITQSQMAG